MDTKFCISFGYHIVGEIVPAMGVQLCALASSEEQSVQESILHRI